VIHVGAASPIVPVALMAQLAIGGVMMIPVGKESQDIHIITKSAPSGKMEIKNH